MGTRSRWPEPGRLRDSSPSLSRSLRSSPTTPANLSLLTRPSLASRLSWLASTITFPRLPSTWLATLTRLPPRLSVWQQNVETRRQRLAFLFRNYVNHDLLPLLG